MNEIQTDHEWAQYLIASDGAPIAVQALDLTQETEALLARSWVDSLFLGCRLSREATVHIVESGGIVVPQLADFEFPVHRATLYGVEALYEGFDPSEPQSYLATPDAKIYAQYCRQGRETPTSLRVSLARRLHDHSMTDALHEALDGQAVAAVMGGHGLERANPLYVQVAGLSRRLAREGFLMITGGGPGAMEACHLGCYLANEADEALADAMQCLSPRPPDAPPGKEYADADWLSRAWQVRERYPAGRDNSGIGIPTWMYGHEPPAAFAGQHAKYFANSVREDGLLMWATHGVVFTPGSAGTIQEIFQDACQNHYQVTGFASPMIFFGVDYWTHEKPVWPLIKQLARGKAYHKWLRLTDDPAEVVELLCDFRRTRVHDGR